MPSKNTLPLMRPVAAGGMTGAVGAAGAAGAVAAHPTG